MANDPVIRVVDQLVVCPECSEPLQKKNLDRISTQRGQKKYGQVQQKRTVTPVRALVCSCRWTIQDSFRLLGKQEGLPEQCGFGHRYPWSLLQKMGNRLDLKCMGFTRDNWPCSLKVSVVLEQQGFLRDGRGNEYNQTKLTVLAVLSQYPEGIPLGEIVDRSGFSRGQVAGSCQRLLKGQYISRSESMELLAPIGRGFLYRLAPRGVGTIKWALDSGWYEEGQ